MRRTIVLVLVVWLGSACSGDRVDRSGFERQQDEVDRAAQVISLVVAEALDGSQPPGEILATGSVTGCKGSPGGAFYHLDTFVRHAPTDAVEAIEAVTKALRAEGFDADYDVDAQVIRVDSGDVTANIGSVGQGDPPSGQAIFVGTDCVDVGQSLAGELSSQPGRPVQR